MGQSTAKMSADNAKLKLPMGFCVRMIEGKRRKAKARAKQTRDLCRFKKQQETVTDLDPYPYEDSANKDKVVQPSAEDLGLREYRDDNEGPPAGKGGADRDKDEQGSTEPVAAEEGSLKEHAEAGDCVEVDAADVDVSGDVNDDDENNELAGPERAADSADVIGQSGSPSRAVSSAVVVPQDEVQDLTTGKNDSVAVSVPESITTTTGTTAAALTARHSIVYEDEQVESGSFTPINACFRLPPLHEAFSALSFCAGAGSSLPGPCAILETRCRRDIPDFTVDFEYRYMEGDREVSVKGPFLVHELNHKDVINDTWHNRKQGIILVLRKQLGDLSNQKWKALFAYAGGDSRKKISRPARSKNTNVKAKGSWHEYGKLLKSTRSSKYLKPLG
ncbi:hypothetical protein KEM56_007065 [Ascosphaera pollenicola]|nr:hypothetical protein KEM56_007065 [Ascosphaera pollenicola]